MNVKIINGLVIDPKNKIHSKMDILFEDNIIKDISKKIKIDTDYVIDAKNMIVSPGFVDVHSNFCDPGDTTKEDLKTGSLSAAKGGFTHILLGVDNKPAPSQCNVIEYINKFDEIMPVNLYPVGAITEDRQGIEMADIQFLQNHGAYAFSDGLRTISDKNLLEKIMIKCKNSNMPLSIFSYDTSKSSKSTSKTNVCLDLKTNLELASKIGCKVEFMYLSEKNEFELFSKYKNENIVSSIQILNFMLNDKSLTKKGSLAKVMPELKSESDRKSVIKAIANDVVDIISTNHVPCKDVDKTKKIKQAPYGSIGLETALGCIGLKLVDDKNITWDKIIEKISLNPAKFYNLTEDGAGSIDIGKSVNITIFDPNETWTLTENDIVSKSHNTPLKDVELKGKVKWTIAEGRLVYKDKKEETTSE